MNSHSDSFLREVLEDEPAQGQTLADVARRAGVSVATASKVLNDRPDVSAVTRQRVRAVVAASGYALRRSSVPRVNVLEVICDNLSSSYESGLLHGITEVAARHGADVVLRLASCDEATLQRRPPNGGYSKVAVVVTAGRSAIDAVTNEMTHVVRCVRIVPRSGASSSVAATPVGTSSHVVDAGDWAKSSLAVDHLVQHGHRRIGLVMASQPAMLEHALLSGYRARLRAAGIVPRSTWMACLPNPLGGGRAHLRSLLTGAATGVTALVVVDDVLAVQILTAARQDGWRAPGDLSVVALGNTEVASLPGIDLTAVHLQLPAVGARAARIALVGSASGRITDTSIPAPVMVVRKSSGPCPRPGRQGQSSLHV